MSRTSPSFGSRLARVFGIAVTALVVVAAAWLADSSMRTVLRNGAALPALAAAGQLQRTNVPSNPADLKDDAELSVRLTGAHCEQPLLNAASGVVLARFLAEKPSADYDAWTAAADDAQRIIRHAIRCAPADGVAWARLALVDRLISYSQERLALLLDHSYQLAPADPVALTARMASWGALPADRSIAPAARSRDFEAILRQAWPPEVAYLLKPLPPSFEPELRSIFDTLPDLRRRYIESEVLFAPQ